MKKIKLNELKKGQWLISTDGIFEVIKEYDAYHGWVTVAEVCFKDEYCTEYTLGEESYISNGDAARYELVS